MKKLTVVSVVAASLVMGSGMALAKGKNFEDDYRNHSYKDEPYYDDEIAPRKHRKHKRLRQNRHWSDYGCIPPRKIKRRLARRGWHSFYIVRMNRRVIRVKATNYNGRRFVLRVDRCDGYILSRRPVRKFWRY